VTVAPIEICGLAAQGFYFARMLIQGVAAERAKRPVAPPIFWTLSIAGAALAALYAWNGPSHDAVITVAQIVNLALYARLARLATGRGRTLGGLGAAAAFAAFVAGTALLLSRDRRLADALTERSTTWLVVALVGQAAWLGRFVFQWLAAERGKSATFSAGFLYVGFAGASLSLAYSIHLEDRVLILGFALVPLLYLRQIVLLRREGRMGNGGD
jgi:lipid-A-disaccharide synthase-like uncharacterized protein